MDADLESGAATPAMVPEPEHFAPAEHHPPTANDLVPRRTQRDPNKQLSSDYPSPPPGLLDGGTFSSGAGSPALSHHDRNGPPRVASPLHRDLVVPLFVDGDDKLVDLTPYVHFDNFIARSHRACVRLGRATRHQPEQRWRHEPYFPSPVVTDADV